MNFRNGFQRLYIALTVVWVALSLFALWPKSQYVSDFLLWDKDHTRDPIELALSMQASISHPEEVAAYMRQEFGTDAWHGWRHIATIVWVRLAAIVFVPPAFFYFVFFYVCRWVYRGFKRDQTAPVG